MTKAEERQKAMKELKTSTKKSILEKQLTRLEKKYGLTHPQTVACSQRLDKLIVEEMREMNKCSA